MSDRVAAPTGGDRAAVRAAGRSVNLFGLQLTDMGLEPAARWIVHRAKSAVVTDVAFLNAHCVNVAYRSPEYRRVMEGMTRIFADGIGMRIAARVAGEDLVDNVNGTDLFPVLCREAAQSGCGIYLFGARDGIAAAAAERLTAQTPGLKISGTHHGYVQGGDAERRLVDEINASGATILLVALGVPSQELWIERNRARLSVPVVVGVGGLFDYYSGRIPRAPLVLRKAGLEWAWRLAQEPRRLAGRYIVGNAVFLARLAWLRLASPAALVRGPAA